MKIFGIGISKTGTKTLGECLIHFGYKHHSWDSKLANHLINGNMAEIYKAIDNNDSFDDWPWPSLYKLLDSRYPDSKFILTVRKDSNVWLNSYVKHAERRGPTREREYFFKHASPHGFRAEHIAFYENHNQEVVEYFKGRPEKLLVVCWETDPSWDKLCQFLGKEIPEIDFPHANKAARPLRFKHVIRRFIHYGLYSKKH